MPVLGRGLRAPLTLKTTNKLAVSISIFEVKKQRLTREMGEN